MSHALAAVVSDLDGTLLGRSGTLERDDRDALRQLGAAGVQRVVATGRSLWSARQVLGPETPIDYLVFSSGVGVLRWGDGRLLRAERMSGERVATASAALEQRGLDFMVHRAPPENHHFFWHRANATGNPDFDRRLDRYRRFAEPWPGALPAGVDASQFVAIEPAGAISRLDELRGALRGFHVVRTTSPLDHRSRWIEIFPDGVSKSSAAAWLCERLAIDRAATLAIGNDYNDTDLLAWAAHAYVVGNAVASLRRRYPVVAACGHGGFAEAVARALGDRVRAAVAERGRD